MDGEGFVLFAFYLCYLWKPLQLNKRLRTLSKALVEVATKRNNRVDMLRPQLLLILDQSHRRFHRPRILFLVHLPLAEQEKVNSFGSLPWVGQCFIGTRADIRSDQGVHCFGGDFRGGLTGACELRHLGIEDTLLVAVYFEGCQDVDFLDQEEGSVLFAHFLRDFCKQSGSVCVLVSLAEKFDGFDFFVLFD